MKTSKFLVYVVLCLAMVFWGFSFVGTKICLGSLQPITLVLGRLIVSSVFLLMLTLSLKLLPAIKRQDLKWFILLTVFEPFLYFIGETFGLQLVSSTLGAVIISTIPLFVPMAAWLVFRDKIGIFNLIGIVVSVVGVLIIIMEPDMSFLVSVKGIALLFLAVASAVGYTMLIRKLSSDYHPAAIITYMNLMGIPFFIPLFFWLDFSAFTYTSIDATVFWTVLALGVFPSSLSYMFFTIGVRDLGVNRASVFTNMIPALTAVFSYFFLGDQLPWYKIVGIAVVIGALMLSQMDSFKKNAG